MVDTDPVTHEQPADAGPYASEIGRQATVGGVFAAVLAVLGGPIGLVWSAIAPRAALVIVAPGQAMPADAESTAYMTADGQFAVLTMGTGVVVAVVAYLVAGRRSGTGAVIGLALGGLLGSLLAWLVGSWPGAGPFLQKLHGAQTGDQITAALTLHARGVVILGALAAVAVFGFIEVCVSTVKD